MRYVISETQMMLSHSSLMNFKVVSQCMKKACQKKSEEQALKISNSEREYGHSKEYGGECGRGRKHKEYIDCFK